MANEPKIKLTLKRSLIGRLSKHQHIIKCLGLRRMHQTVEVIDNPCTRGMVNTVSYLLQIEEVA